MKKNLLGCISVQESMLRKTVLIMKWSFVFLFLFCMQVSAKVHSQTKLTLKLEKASLSKVFLEIEKKTQFRFLFDEGILPAEKNVDVNANEEDVNVLLSKVLKGTGLIYHINDNDLIVISSGEEIKTEEFEKVDKTVKGKVTNTNGEPLNAASVVIKGTKTGAQTDAEGNFTIVMPENKSVLVVSSVGYQQQEVTVVGNGVSDIRLVADNTELNTVVVTGYTKQSKRDVTGAVSTISADVVAKTPVPDVASILQGRVAGVTVDGQGGPGNAQVVRVRGIGTLGNNDPLYVIDGVQTTGGLNLINPNDIETITVLKDAASCALYGARGSNGVIVITTKRGKTGAPKLEYNTYLGYEVPRKFPEMVSPQQFADAYWGYLKNAGLTLNSPIYGNGANPILPDVIIENTTTTPFFGGVASGDPRAAASLYNLNNYRIFNTNKNGTDWFDEVFNPAFTQSHQLALSGANDKSNYALTFNYLDNKGTLMNSYFKRYSIRVNTEFKIKPWLRFGENLQFSYGQQNTVGDHTDQNIIAGLYNTSPIMPVYDIAGNFTGTKGSSGLDGSNAVMSRVNSKNFNGYNARLLGAGYVELEPVKNLVFQSKLTIDYLPYQNHSFKTILPQEQFDNGRNAFYESAGHSLEWRLTNKVSYDKTIASIHKINVFVAYEASKYTTRYLNGSNDSLFSLANGFMYLGTGSPTTAKVGGGQDKLTYISVFGNLNYALADKYLASFTLRRDGSSKFGPLNRYGMFPSGSIGWRVSGEKFMRNVTWVNNLKLRASLGTSGNEASLPGGATLNQYGSSAGYQYYDLNGTNTSAMQGFALTQIGNPFLQWEVNKTTNVGLDAAFFKNKFNVSFNWFNRKTDKLLYQPPVTALQGDAFSPYQNVMNFTNKGLELELGYVGPKKGNFSYDVNFNISTYRNNVTYIDGDPATFILGDKYARQTSLTRSVVGTPVSSFYGYVWEGTFTDTKDVGARATQPGIDKANAEKGLGHFKFADLDSNGVIDNKDQTFIGNPHPKFTYGFNLNLYYKNIDLGIFIQGVSGNKIMNYWRTTTEWPGRYGIGSLDTWSTSNTDAKLPIYDANKSTLDAQSSTFFVENGSYVRLKNVQLGYTFPSMKGISKLRVYVQAYNLATITKYSGMDPEVNTGQPGAIGIDFGGNYPLAQKFLFGINLGL